MIKGIGDIGEMMKQAEDLQKKVSELQEKMGGVLVSGESGGGLVKAVCTGKGDLKSLDIDPSLFTSKEKDVVEDLIVAAVNEAKKKAAERQANAFDDLSASMGLPRGFRPPLF